MFVMIWSSTGNLSALEMAYTGWWNDEAKLAVTFSVLSGVAGVLFVMQQLTLYSWDGQDDSDQGGEMRENRNRGANGG